MNAAFTSSFGYLAWGRKKLTRERAAYFQLMQEGHSNREACRIVGINARTGKRWRNGWHAPHETAPARRA